ncbi:hypothetical protein [Nocardia sp. IFM 10818]
MSITTLSYLIPKIGLAWLHEPVMSVEQGSLLLPHPPLTLDVLCAGR